MQHDAHHKRVSRCQRTEDALYLTIQEIFSFQQLSTTFQIHSVFSAPAARNARAARPARAGNNPSFVNSPGGFQFPRGFSIVGPRKSLTHFQRAALLYVQSEVSQHFRFCLRQRSECRRYHAVVWQIPQPRSLGTGVQAAPGLSRPSAATHSEKYQRLAPSARGAVNAQRFRAISYPVSKQKHIHLLKLVLLQLPHLPPARYHARSSAR